MTEQVDLAANRVYHSGHVFKLTLDSVAYVLTALTASPPVNRIHRKLLLKRRKNGCPTLDSASRAMHQHERRSCSAFLIGDRRAIFRRYFFHDTSLLTVNIAM